MNPLNVISPSRANPPQRPPIVIASGNVRRSGPSVIRPCIRSRPGCRWPISENGKATCVVTAQGPQVVHRDSPGNFVDLHNQLLAYQHSMASPSYCSRWHRTCSPFSTTHRQKTKATRRRLRTRYLLLFLRPPQVKSENRVLSTPMWVGCRRRRANPQKDPQSDLALQALSL